MSAFLVVGLGNPGPQYAATRHNVGFEVADLLADRAGASFKRHRSGAEIAEVHLGMPPAPRAVLAKPQSFMNVSGGPTKALAGYFDVPPEQVIVVHDELDLPLGAIRLKLGGGDNGHNGLRSLRGSLGTGDFYRVRAGIGRPPGRQDVSDFVLSNYSSTERKELPFQVIDAADAVESLISDGLAATQQKFNS